MKAWQWAVAVCIAGTGMTIGANAGRSWAADKDRRPIGPRPAPTHQDLRNAKPATPAAMPTIPGESGIVISSPNALSDDEGAVLASIALQQLDAAKPSVDLPKATIERHGRILAGRGTKPTTQPATQPSGEAAVSDRLLGDEQYRALAGRALDYLYGGLDPDAATKALLGDLAELAKATASLQAEANVRFENVDGSATTKTSTAPAGGGNVRGLVPADLTKLGRFTHERLVAGQRGEALIDAVRWRHQGLRRGLSFRQLGNIGRILDTRIVNENMRGAELVDATVDALTVVTDPNFGKPAKAATPGRKS